MKPKTSLELYLEAIEAYDGHVYPLSSWFAKYAPPSGMTGKYCKQVQTWMLEDEHEWSEIIEAASTGAGKTPEDAENDAERWVNTVLRSSRFAFCGYPPAGYVALDVDTPDVIREVERELNLAPGQLKKFLKSTPAIINTAERTLKAHHYILVENKEYRDLLGKMMAMQVPGGHLGDLICIPDHGSSGGKYQKLHGGHDGADRTEYRLVDKNGVEQPYSHVKEAPELPYELYLAIKTRFTHGSFIQRNNSTKKKTHAAPDVPQDNNVDESMTQIFPIKLPSEPTGETAVEKVKKLFYEAYTQEEQFKLATTDMPAGCKYKPHHSGEHRIECGTQRSGQAGAVINIHPPGHKKSSNIHFYSHNVKEAYLGTSEGSNTLNLSTIATLPQHDWCRSDQLVGRIIGVLEKKLGINQTDEDAELANLLENQPEPKENLLPSQLKHLMTSQKMRSLLAEHNLEFNFDKEDKQAYISNSNMAVRVLISKMAQNDCYVQNNTIRARGQTFDGEDREVALAPILHSPTLKKVILENWELFHTQGWIAMMNSPQAHAEDAQQFTSEMMTYGFYDIHTGQGSPSTCLEDSKSGALYVPDEHKLVRVVSGDGQSKPTISKSKTNHAVFAHLEKPTRDELSDVVQQAKMVLASIIRFSEQRGPIVYRDGQYSNNPLYKGALMPHDQSRAALLIAFLSEALTGRSQTWLHLDGQDSTSTGKSTFMELARRVIPGTVKTKLSSAFGNGNEYDKQALIGQRFVIDDEFGYASNNTVDGMKDLITNGVTARHIRGRTTYYTKPMSIITATNRSLIFQHADGIAGSIERRFLRMPCLPLCGDDDTVDRKYLQRINKREWEAFMTILAQPYLFGLEHACTDLRKAGGGGEITHQALCSLKEQAKTDGVIATPTDDWLRDAIVAGEPTDFLVRPDVFAMMQHVSDIPVRTSQNESTTEGAMVMARLDAHIRRLGGSIKKRKWVKDEFSGGRRRPYVHTGVVCRYRLTSDGGVVQDDGVEI